MKARLILLCGLPGSGKTTLARKLAEEMPAVRLCPDEWKADLGIDFYDEEMRVRLERKLFELAWNLLTLGQDVILEFGFWARVERDELREIARKRGYSVELYFLDTPFEELARRLAVRNAKAEHGTAPIEREKLEEYAGIFQAPTDAELVLFDKPTVRESQILNSLSHEGYDIHMSKPQFSDAEQLVDEVKALMHKALGDKLRGLYLFGSLVGGDFDPKTSDIDLLAIVESDITENELRSLKAMHEALIHNHPEWNDRIEVAYVGIEAMRNFKTSIVTIARISPGEPLHYCDMDIRWLVDWHMVQEQGLVIDGPSPKTFIPTITKDEFVASIKSEFSAWLERAKEARWVGYQSYVILSLCRNLYAIRFGQQVSKFKGASWAAKEYPQWASLIQHATKWHGSPDKSDSPDTQVETIRFAEFMVVQG